VNVASADTLASDIVLDDVATSVVPVSLYIYSVKFPTGDHLLDRDMAIFVIIPPEKEILCHFDSFVVEYFIEALYTPFPVFCTIQVSVTQFIYTESQTDRFSPAIKLLLVTFDGGVVHNGDQSAL